MLRHTSHYIGIGLLATLFAGCGGSSSGSLNLVTGTFVDSPVQGLSYTCSSNREGLTNAKGEYTCLLGDDVTFSAGGVTIGKVAAQEEPITPYLIFPSNEKSE